MQTHGGITARSCMENNLKEKSYEKLLFFLFSQEWDVDRGINVNGSVLTYEGEKEVDPDKWVFGARYTRPLCPECPNFEVEHLFSTNL